MSLRGDELTALVDGVMAGVDREIVEHDSMYGGNDEHYFGVGRDALRAVLDALHGASRPAPARVLDFGCGYGRVLRTLRAAFPEAELVACDLDPAAVARCVAAYAAVPLAASVDVDEIEQVREVDLVWCGSVLTHLDAPQWGPVLRYFARALRPGGIAVVTTHGRRVAWRMQNVAERTYGLTEQVLNRVLATYYAAGFGYGDYPGQDGYGISLSSPGWAADKALEAPGLRLVGYREAAWDQHQDVLVLAKDADAVLKVHR
ncbi:class I SAM-dependent methyltransferase [Saccharothrix syringae]|uniref:class I SAM-dependent methyltransferase n=1 Tax=Saccharothrix syringae TaxID=103733 RepID=UPI000B31B759|nr:class I SAM-dependent methyltransferase [Saccharothrix syringae]